MWKVTFFALLCVWSTTVNGLSLPGTPSETALLGERRVGQRELKPSEDEEVEISGAKAVQYAGEARRPPGDREPPHYCPQLRQPGFRRKGGVELPAIPNKEELIYLMPTLVGGQELMLLVDTGSADFYVLGPQVEEEKRRGRRVFTSPNYTPIPGSRFDLAYINGDTATGSVVRSDVNIGGIELPSQNINVASYVKHKSPMDGLIGMSAGKGVGQGKAPLENYFLRCFMSTVRRPVFAANLRPGAPSTYQFGFYDDSRPIQWVYTNRPPEDGQWQFNAVGARVGSFSVNRPMPSLVDTGSSLLGLDEDVVRAYYSTVSGAIDVEAADGYIFPCDAELPEVEISITDSYRVTVPGSLIKGPPLRGGLAQAFGVNFCQGTLQAKVDDVQSFGVIFLQTQYTVFDRGSLRLGFAPHKA
ncbi:MAG: putative electron transfer flavoprotein subunit [Watsoniomyces obsoletus]|nr:MAG: putative electron transfer flavoprotein subunit [Watsoniomyces obsoletus]